MTHIKAPTAIICLSPYSGGMELDTIKIAKTLTTVASITLVVQEGKFIANRRKTYEGINGLAVETISFRSSLSLTIITKVRRIIKTQGIKNVLFFGASELKSLYFAFLGLGINLIIRHGTTKSSPKKDWFHRLIYSNVDTHVAICEHLAENVRHIIPFGKKTQLKIIYPSLNMTPEHRVDFDAKPHTPLQLVHVGRIARGKGQMAAINACAALHENDIPFELQCVGGMEEGYKKEFTAFFDTVAYKEHVKLIGHTDDVQRHLLHSDIFLFPSDGEGLGNAFIEAMAYGLAAISYDNTSFPELRKLGFTFEMVPDQDTAALKASLLHLARKYYVTDTLKSNQALALTLFSIKNERDKFLQILR